MSDYAPPNPEALIAELDALLGAAPVLAPEPRRSAAAVLEPPTARPEAGLGSPIALPALLAPKETPARSPQAAALEPVSEPAPGPAPEPAPAVEGPKRVLVVDDNKDYREIVRYLLNENGYEALTAEDGAEGLRMALDYSPHLVLLDFNMPQMNGYELVQELRRNFETRKIPLIMFTGAPNRHALRNLDMDLCDFLEKPVSNAKLLASVAQALRMPEARQAPAPEAAGSAPPRSSAAVGARASELSPASAPAPEELADLQSHEGLLIDIETEKKEEEFGLEAITNDSPLVARVNKILISAVDMGASDIHIEPQEKEIVVRLRLNGSLHKLCSLPSSLKGRLAARIKIMSNLVITERRLPQDGQIRALIKDKRIEFRVSTLPSAHGEKIVMRVLGGGKIKGNLAQLGFSERDLSCVEQALQTPHGLILVTGPTGSGKTTTLYTMIRAVSKPDVNVLTAEDPIEYELSGITQVHIKPAIGLTFEVALRSFLRQDPDVMLVGEIRDLETSEIAVKASITGHLVFSTLHTNSAAATVTRLAHMGLAPFLVAASLKLVVAQRLVRVLCPECRLQVPLSEYEKKMLSEAELGLLRQEAYRGVGCRSCQQTGYRGRKPLFEVMPVRTPEMRQRIIAASNQDQIRELAVIEGMSSLRQEALAVVAAGETSLTEAFKLILAE